MCIRDRDKSTLIKELLKTTATKVTLITRPRRFGKTLAMSMLANFFDICRESHSMFKDLEITKEEAICAQWQNQWPVLFLSFKDIDGVSFENALEMFRFTLSQLCITHAYLDVYKRQPMWSSAPIRAHFIWILKK